MRSTKAATHLLQALLRQQYTLLVCLALGNGLEIVLAEKVDACDWQAHQRRHASMSITPFVTSANWISAFHRLSGELLQLNA